MAYNYGPPPPAPPPAPAASGGSGPPMYASSYHQRGGHSGRGRGAPDRGGYHQPPPAYGYGQPPAPYGQQNSSYPGPHQPPQGGYPPQQQWHPEHAQQHPPQQQPPAANPLPAENYHPNYAPQIYQQPAYGAQQPYPPAPQPAYGSGYPASGPPAQQWGAQPPPNQPPYGNSSSSRGGRGYGDRGGHKGQLMGPPIRMGFDGAQAPPAPVSNPYAAQPYGGPQAPPAPYPAPPFQGYQHPVPYMPGPAPYDGNSGHGPRHHGRGGFHGNGKPRPQFGGDKMRNRNRGPSAQTPPAHHQKPDAASTGKKKKRKTNTLGLTPGDESDEFDENEEELEQMYGADAPMPEDIAAWIAERRANFPTKARIEAKKAAEAASKSQNGDGSKNGENRDALEQKAQKLRERLEKVESSIKRKREQQDEGDDMRDIDLSSSSSSDIKSDDEKPEVMSTRQESFLPPPPKKADPKKHCKYYSTGGTCGKRGKCRFVHDPAVREQALKERERNGGRMTLQQRLTLNDKEQDDLAIVQTLKFLQDKGVFPKKSSAHRLSENTGSGAQEEPKPLKQDLPVNGHGLPPIPPPSVVSQGTTSKYSGWNLSGFGNTGVRPGDA